jgi:SAM-dependent methyltransferase
MMNLEEVFAPDSIRGLGLEYNNGMVKTLNRTGYMRNFLSELEVKFSSQQISQSDPILEIGCGVGAVLRVLIESGFTNLVGVDRESGHLEIVRSLLRDTLADRQEVRLTLIATSLPHLEGVTATGFSSILCSQVLHYMSPTEFEVAAKRLHQLLSAEGRLYLSVGSPYNESYKGFGKEYERRVAAAERFPGYMADPRIYNPKGLQHHPGAFLFFDPSVLAQRLSEFGFKILEASYIDVSRQKKGLTGLVAVKK